MAGVSLVADAAEQLERTAITTRDCPGQANGKFMEGMDLKPKLSDNFFDW